MKKDNDIIFNKTSKCTHNSKKENTVKEQEMENDNTENIKSKTEEESFSNEGIKSYELKKYLELKKEIAEAKKELFKKFLISGTIGIIIFILTTFFFFSLKENRHQSETLNNNVNTKTLRQLQKDSKLIKEQLKIIADNQKILNQKIIAVYKAQTQMIKNIDSNMQGIFNYLKTEGKIIEMVSQIIMNDDVKLNKIVEKVYQSKITDSIASKNTEQNISNPKAHIVTPDLVKKEIKQETDNIINKYKNLLKELQ